MAPQPRGVCVSGCRRFLCASPGESADGTVLPLAPSAEPHHPHASCRLPQHPMPPTASSIVEVGERAMHQRRPDSGAYRASRLRLALASGRSHRRLERAVSGHSRGQSKAARIRKGIGSSRHLKATRGAWARSFSALKFFHKGGAAAAFLTDNGGIHDL